MPRPIISSSCVSSQSIAPYWANRFPKDAFPVVDFNKVQNDFHFFKTAFTHNIAAKIPLEIETTTVWAIWLYEKAFARRCSKPDTDIDTTALEIFEEFLERFDDGGDYIFANLLQMHLGAKMLVEHAAGVERSLGLSTRAMKALSHHSEYYLARVYEGSAPKVDRAIGRSRA